MKYLELAAFLIFSAVMLPLALFMYMMYPLWESWADRIGKM